MTGDESPNGTHQHPAHSSPPPARVAAGDAARHTGTSSSCSS